MFSFKNRLLLVLSLVIIFICLNGVYANDDFNQTLGDNSLDSNAQVFYVDVNGNDNNTGLSKNQSVKSLNKVFDSYDSSNDLTIYIANGIYSSENNTNVILWYNSSKITIIGEDLNKTILNGENLHKFFWISKDTNVVLANLTLINGYDTVKGGAIENYGNLTLVNCNFKNNKISTGTASSMSNLACGGAIYNNGSLNIINSSFISNSAGSIYTTNSYGGAIYNLGSLSIKNSVFNNNALDTFIDWTYNNNAAVGFIAFQEGAAIASYSNNVEIINTSFANNQIDVYSECFYESSSFCQYSAGGAVYFEGDNYNFIDCSFNNNNADTGGAIYYKGNNVMFDNCDFKNNSAFRGGALMTIDYNPNSNSYFWHNLTSNPYKNLTISNCNFINNLITQNHMINIYFRIGYGAGAAYLKVDDVSVINSSFENNGLKKDYKKYKNYNGNSVNFCHSGAIFFYGQNSIVINSTFDSNNGEFGGAIMTFGFDTNIYNCSFCNNSAFNGDGGAIYHSIGNITVDNCYFDLNTATRYGGAIQASYMYTDEYIFDQQSVYKNSLFKNNSASYGGAIWDNGNLITYKNLTFTFNNAAYGGAVYNQGFGNKFTDSQFNDNFATGAEYSNGGAIFNSGSNADYVNCNFNNNSAYNWGGAIYNFGDNIYCVNSSFYNNSAFKGGALYLNGAAGRVQNNNFTINFATYGGAIHNMVSDLIISYNSFISSHANVSGGAIYNTASTLTLYSNSMSDCRAALSGYGFGNCVYTEASISYLVLSFLNNGTFNIADNKNASIFASVSDNLGNPITGGNVTFMIVDSSTGKNNIIGSAKVFEGKAYLEYGDILELGKHYILTGVYSYGANPVLTKKGVIAALLSSKMMFEYYGNIDNVYLGENLPYSIVLIDSKDNYISNAEIMVYENGVYITSVYTNENGYLNSTLTNFFTMGVHHFSFIYNGDLLHDRNILNVNVTAVFNNNHFYNDVMFFAYYPIVITSPGSEIPFEYHIAYNKTTPLNDVSTNRYFLVYRNGEMVPLKETHDYIGLLSGTNYLFYYVTVNGFTSKVYHSDSNGNFLMPIVEVEPGLYIYKIAFTGGLVKQYNVSTHNHVNEEDNHFNGANVSVILIVDCENTTFDTKLNVNGSFTITEVDYADFYVNLTDSMNKPITDSEVLVYDHGELLGRLTTDELGGGYFKFPKMLDKGEHLIEFVFVGNKTHSSSYNAFYLNVEDNPNKYFTDFTVDSSLNVTGEGNYFNGTLSRLYGEKLANSTVEIAVYSGSNSVKNYTVVTNDKGSFSMPIDFGAGNYTVYCHYSGNKFYEELSSSFNLIVNKIDTMLFGIGSLDVVGEDNYLTLVLVDKDYSILSNSRIRIDVYSLDYNTTYYVYTNGSGVAKLKINLPVGYYQVLSTYEGSKYYSSNSVLSKLTVFGDYSILSVNKTVILKEKGNYYFVKLTDSKGKPLIGETVVISVCGVSYSKVTDDNGFAKLKINLNYGSYLISSCFKGNVNYKGSSSSSTLYVVNSEYKFPSLLNANSSLTFRGKGNNYTIVLSDIYGNPISGEYIRLTVNNIGYLRVTDSNGKASLVIDLDNGDYIINSYFKGNSNYQASSFTSNLKIVNEFADNTILDSPVYLLLKGKGNYFKVTLKDKLANPLSGETVIIKVCGVSYFKVTDDRGVARLKINLNAGSYDVYCYYRGNDNYFASESVTKLVVLKDDISSYLNASYNVSILGKGKYSVTLTDSKGNPLVNKKVNFSVYGMFYTRITNDKGIAKLNINLMPGAYKISASFNGDNDYRPSNTVNSIITVKSTISGNNIVKYYRNASQFYAKLVNLDGTPLAGKGISINIYGVFYLRYTNDQGIVKLNINLSPGDYILTVIDPNTNIMASFNVSVLPTIIVSDLVKVFKNDSQYLIKLIDGAGNPVAGKNITINIYGVFYTRTTDSNGIAILNINLNPGRYIATVLDPLNGLYRSSNILVLENKPVLSAPKEFKIGFYKSPVMLSLKESSGKAISGESVRLVLDGKTYFKTTDNDGVVRLDVNLGEGNYLLYSYYDLANLEALTKIVVI